MEELGAIWAVQGFLAPFISLVATLPVVIYIVARWRGYREGAPHDPQLGLKVALSFFRITAYQIVLAGLALLAYGLLLSKMGDDGKEVIMRTAFGLIIPGLLVFGAHFAALKQTNQDALPGVTRMFTGLSLVQTGLVGFLALIAAFVIAMQKGEMGEDGRIAWAMAIVYVIAWSAQGYFFQRQVGDGPPPSSVQASV